MARRVLKWGLLVSAVALVVIQLVPYGRGHSDPKVTKAPVWHDPAAQQLFKGSCGDCHSNRTEWPWYTNVAPVSWLVQQDVDEGREVLNLSEWDKAQPELGELIEEIQSGGMPPSKYTLVHSGASLSPAEKRKLIAGLTEIYRTDPPAGIRGDSRPRLEVGAR